MQARVRILGPASGPARGVVLAYYKAIRERCAARVIPTDGMLDPQKPEWKDYPEAFTTPVGSKFVNVVIAEDMGSFQKFWTQGVKNIGVFPGNRPDELVPSEAVLESICESLL